MQRARVSLIVDVQKRCDWKIFVNTVMDFSKSLQRQLFCSKRRS